MSENSHTQASPADFGQIAEPIRIWKSRTQEHGWRVLYLGSLGDKGQQELLDATADLKADILIIDAPRENLREDLLDRVSPRAIVFGADEKPFQRRNNPVLKKQLAARSIPAISTENREAVTLKLTARECRLEKMSGPLFLLARQ